MEQLCLLLRLAGHVMADPGEGETPMIPLPIAHAAQASLDAGQVYTYVVRFAHTYMDMSTSGCLR